jgi:hypothetical protein
MGGTVLARQAGEMSAAVRMLQPYYGISESVEQKLIKIFIPFQQVKYLPQSTIVYNFLMWREVMMKKIIVMMKTTI